MRLAQDFLVEIPVLRFTDRLTKARQILRDDRFREVYVVDGRKKLIGYIDITDTLRLTATKSEVTVGGFSRDAPGVQGGDTLERVARTIRDYRTDSAAVIDQNRHVAGGVLLSDIFPALISRHELRGTVADYMSQPAVVADPSDTVQHIHGMMTECGYSAIPVVYRRKLVGIISRRDLLSAGRIRNTISKAAQVPIADLMEKNVVTIGMDDAISNAAEILVRHDVSRLPVVEAGVVRGILGRHDALAALG